MARSEWIRVRRLMHGVRVRSGERDKRTLTQLLDESIDANEADFDLDEAQGNPASAEGDESHVEEA